MNGCGTWRGTRFIAMVAAVAWIGGVGVATAGADQESVSFEHDVMPLLDSFGCNAAACHGGPAGAGGLKLSMFAGDPAFDHAALTREAGGRRIDRVDPESSSLLKKVSGELAHEGGGDMPPDSAAYQTLLAWVKQGAPLEAADQPRLVHIEADVDRLVLNEEAEGAEGNGAEQAEGGQASESLTVTAVFSDDSRRDVTHLARFESIDTDVAAVDSSGRVRRAGAGETTVVARYLRHPAMVRVLAPRPMDEPFEPVDAYNRIDELVFGRLKELGLPPAPRSGDAQFLRRVYLDTTGLLPSPERVREFLADEDEAKRSRLIDELLASEDFVDYWTLKWADLMRLKSESQVDLWPNAVQAYHQWIRRSIAENKPLDEWVRQLLTATGSNFYDPPSNYYRAMEDRSPQGIASDTALLFMGKRLDCASCHAHPRERWTPDDVQQMAAFFSQVRYKGTREWKEQVVHLDRRRGLRDPRTHRVVQPALPGGEQIEVPAEGDRRAAFARWLTAPENPYFARSVANRVWAWLVGEPIVDEVDDLRPTNPPRHPELLDYLAEELIDSGYDLHHLIRLILNARTYQAAHGTDPAGARHFAHRRPRRLEAEPWLDAVNQVTETHERFRSWVPEPHTELPSDFRAAQVRDGSMGVPLLELFGRPSRDSPYQSDRCDQPSTPQALHMLNSDHIHNRISRSPRIDRWVESEADDDAVIDELYLAALSRPPSDDDREALKAYLAAHEEELDRRQLLADLMWAVLNTQEFMLNH